MMTMDKNLEHSPTGAVSWDNRLSALGLLASPLLVALLADSPSAALHLLTSTAPTASLVAGVALLAWACAGWLLLVVAVTWLAELPGLLGQVGAHASKRLAPASVRAAARLALGTTVAVTVLAGPAASAATGPRSPLPAVAATSDFDWPGATTRAPLIAPPAHPIAATPAAPSGSEVVVHGGDSLWSITARDLGPAASTRQIAQTWPRWWAANRAVIGDDPDLIRPGLVLVRPAT